MGTVRPDPLIKKLHLNTKEFKKKRIPENAMVITNINFEGLLNEEHYFEFDSEGSEYGGSAGEVLKDKEGMSREGMSNGEEVNTIRGGYGNDNENWTKYEEERVLYVYFRDLLTEPLLTSADEKELGAKIKECEKRAQRIQKEIEGISNPNQTQAVRGRLPGGSNDASYLRKLDTFNKIYSEKAHSFKSQFIRSNLRFVISISKRYLGRGLPLTDLV